MKYLLLILVFISACEVEPAPEGIFTFQGEFDPDISPCGTTEDKATFFRFRFKEDSLEAYLAADVSFTGTIQSNSFDVQAEDPAYSQTNLIFKTEDMIEGQFIVQQKFMPICYSVFPGVIRLYEE